MSTTSVVSSMDMVGGVPELYSWENRSEGEVPAGATRISISTPVFFLYSLATASRPSWISPLELRKVSFILLSEPGSLSLLQPVRTAPIMAAERVTARIRFSMVITSFFIKFVLFRGENPRPINAGPRQLGTSVFSLIPLGKTGLHRLRLSGMREWPNRRSASIGFPRCTG